jgi:hypothetical protein
MAGVTSMEDPNLRDLDAADSTAAGDRLDFMLKEREADLRAPILLVGTGPSSIIDLRGTWAP